MNEDKETPSLPYLIIFHFWNGFLNGYIPQTEGRKSAIDDIRDHELLSNTWEFGFSCGAYHATSQAKLN